MSSHPDFSIIIPTRDRHHQLSCCLESITCLDYSRSRFEVIVVNDGGRAPIEPVISPFEDRLDVALLNQSGAGPATARNAGIKKARGRYIALTDDDCKLAPNWLQKFQRRLDSDSRRAFGGRTINALANNVYSTASQLLVSYLYDYYNADKDEARFMATNNIAFPADMFRALGGFDPSFPGAAAEDRDFCERWLMAGYSMTYAPEIIVYHGHPLSPSTYWQQHFAYGRGAFRFQRAHARRSGKGFKLEPLAFYTGLLRCPFIKGQNRLHFFLAAMLVVSQIGNTAGFLWECANQALGRNG